MPVVLRLCLFVVAIASTTRGQEKDPLAAAEALIAQERWTEAEALLRPLASSSDTQARFRLAYVEFRQRKLTDAANRFRQIVREAPPAYNSRYFLGRIALAENRPGEAIEWLAPVVAARETIYDAASQLAAAYVSAQQPRKAIEPLKLAIQQTPWDGALYYRLGRIYQSLTPGPAQAVTNAALAREALETSARLKKASAADVETLMQASAALEAGRTLEAAELGRRVIERPNAEPSTLVAAGLVWARAGMDAVALDAFARAARADANHFASHFNWGLSLIRQGRPAEAIEPLMRSVKLLPQSFDANLTLGLAAVMLQRYADAQPFLEAARKLDNSNPRVATLLATAYVRTGAATKAVALLRDSGAADAPEASGPLMLVEALNAAGQAEAALEVAQKTAERFPKQASAVMALAQQLTRAGRYRDALGWFEKTLQLEPGQPEALLGLGDCRQRGGEHEAALDAYRPAMNFRTTTLAARLGASRSLIALRRLPEARQTLEEGLSTHANEPTLRLELSRVYTRLGMTDLAARETEIVNRLRAGSSGVPKP